ncbi:MAG: PGF-CTERM sorting domain-containing protein [Candidatus Methanoperedens sp.]|nr:PGF-CTERM sorting domain-containing protein [Candidatus Methanoperedens sp.]
MKSENALAALLAVIFVVSLAIVLINSDALMKEQEYKPSAYFSIREIDVKPVEVTSSLIEVNVTAYIYHGEGEAKNPIMLIRAINSNTGLHEAEVSTPIPESDSDKTVTASAKLKVERNGNYDLRILLYDNGSIRESGSVGIKGLNALTPAAKQSGVSVNNIDFIVAGASGGIASIRSDVYLENKWAAPSENMNMIVKARQAESNLLADKKASETGVIAGEATSVKSVQLDVPEGYNYMMVVELWKGDVLVNTWEKALMLAPTKTVPKESQEKKMNIEVSKFVREGGAPPVPGEMDKGAPSYAATPKMEPGFEAIVAIAALILVIALRRRS